jgi:hypothetical protein
VNKRRQLTSHSSNPASDSNQLLLAQRQTIPCILSYRAGHARAPVADQYSALVYTSASYRKPPTRVLRPLKTFSLSAELPSRNRARPRAGATDMNPYPG